MKKYLFVLTMVLLLISLTMSAYSESKPDKYGGILRQALRVGPATPIGYPAEAAPDATWAGRPALEAFARTRDGGIVEPVLATSWKVAQDRKSLILTLRKGVKFHDGTDFNAQAAKWNLDRLIKARKVRDFTSVDIIDNYTLRCNIKSFKNTIIGNLSRPLMISPTAVEKNGLDWARWRPVGTGPFKFVEYIRDAKLFYKRNENYWQKEKPYIDGLEFVVIADKAVQKIAFQKGDIHSLRASGLLAKELKDLGYKYVTRAGGTFLLIPDSKNEGSPFANKKVRLAVSHAIDRKSMAKALGFGFSRPAYHLYPGHSVTSIPNLDIHEFNPEKAKKLLAEAGYPNGFKTSIHTFVRVVPRDYITVIANMLGNIGITVKADFPEAGKYTEYRMKGWKNSLMAHALASMDANMNYGFSMYFGGIQFPSLQKSAAWKKAYDTALTSIDFDSAKTKAMIKLMHDEVMVIPYMEETAVTFFQKGVHDTGELKDGLTTWEPEVAWFGPEYRKK
ncbi:ABC transporter substrate-binding protein [Thermodesulfobacteriota bacterium]